MGSYLIADAVAYMGGAVGSVLDELWIVTCVGLLVGWAYVFILCMRSGKE